MKKILSVLLALVMVLSMIPVIASAEDTTVVFNLGANGSATHNDGKDATSYTETVNGYTLSITGGTKMYTGAFDAKGNSCIKLGTSSVVGSFSFTVADDVTQVVIYAAKYKAKTSKLSVNGTTYTLSNSSDNGAYDEITVDTSSTKTVNVTTVSGGVRAMVNSIEFVVAAGGDDSQECTHANTTPVEAVAATCTTIGYTAGVLCNDCETYIEGHEVVAELGHNWSDWAETTAPGCVDAGVETSTCANCGATKTQAIAATGHNYVDDICSGCGKEKGAAVATLITSADEFVSGEYVLVASSGYAMGVYEDGWILPVEPEIVDGEMLDTANGVWTLTVDGASVIIEDANGEIIKPKGGNNNGISNGDYAWAWSANEDGTFVFAGVDTDTVKLASNTDATNGLNRFRGYKTTTVDGDTKGIYLANFSVYKLNEGGEVEPDEPETPACEHTNTTVVGAVEATCTTAGATGNTVCSDCGETVKESEEIAILEHTYVDGSCSVCGAEDPNAGTEEVEDIIFQLGADGDATHADGSTATAYSETVGKYTLTLTDIAKMYSGSRDAKGNGCLKLGTSSVVGGFSFGVPDEVTEVIICIAKYKANTTKVKINGTEYTLTKNSNDGEYDEITVDTSTSKTVSVTTVSGGVRAMVNSITFICSTEGESDHTCVWDEGTVTTAATCLEEGVLTYSCTVEGCDKIKTEAIAKTTHNMVNGACSICGAEYYTLSTTLNNNDSVVIYYPGSKVAMSAAASGNKLSGATATIDESGLLTNTDLAIMQVQYLEGNSTDFYLICNGKYLTSGETGNSLTFADEASDYAVWHIEVVEGGNSTVFIHTRNAVFNGNAQSLEFYSGFTTYTTKTTEIYQFQLYTKGENDIACEHSWSDWEIVTNATCTTAGEQKSVCANCGDEKTQTIVATGHTYDFGDEAVICSACDLNVAKVEIVNVPKTADSNTYYVEGVVTFVDGGTVYIQDATAGIALRLASGVSAPAIGTKVEAIGSCSVYNGLIQLQNADFEAVSTDNAVEAQEVTLAQLKADTELAYLSEKVSMKNLTITAVGTYSADYKNVDYTVTDGTNTFKLYRAPAASADAVLKVGDVINVTGVVGIYNTDYQLRVVSESDIVVVPSVKITHISLDPTNDALGYKAATTNAPEGSTIEISLWVYETTVVTKPVAEGKALRLKNILANNGGEMTIYAKATLKDAQGNVIAESAVAETTMKDTIIAVNAIGNQLNDDQALAVFAYYEQYQAIMDAWLGDNNDIQNWG